MWLMSFGAAGFFPAALFYFCLSAVFGVNGKFHRAKSAAFLLDKKGETADNA